MSYEVFPSKRIQISLYDHSTSAGSRYSGMFTAFFTCHDPFGQLIHVWDDGSCSETEYTMTGILPTELMPPAPAPGSMSFLLYNPGYEEAHTLFRLSGDVGEDGLLIRNFTTGQRCRVVGLKKRACCRGLPGSGQPGWDKRIRLWAMKKHWPFPFMMKVTYACALVPHLFAPCSLDIHKAATR